MDCTADEMIDEAVDSLLAGQWDKAQAEALIAIAMLLGDFQLEFDQVPAGPISYDEYGGDGDYTD